MDDATRARLEAHAEWLGEMRSTLDSPKIADDILEVLAAYDAQAPIVQAAAEIAVLWPVDPKLWAWEEIEALVATVAAARAVGDGE